MLLKLMNSQALNRSVPGVMASEEDVLRATVALCARVLQARVLDLARKQPRKREWVRKWISRRQAQGASNNLLKELALEDPTTYRKVLRLTCENFEELWIKVHPFIHKKDTLMRPAIPSRTKLEIPLRFLATGDSYQPLELLFRVFFFSLF